MTDTASLQNHLLIAMPQLNDPWFGSSLCYICEHTSEGAMGLVINKPLDLELGDVFEELGIAAAYRKKLPVFRGGPVSQEQGFILYRGIEPAGQSLEVAKNTFLSTSKDMLDDMAGGGGPLDIIVCLGYAGWEAGQLEEELAGNSWLAVQADEDILFHTHPDEQSNKAAQKLGFDISQLSGVSGHA